MGLSRLSRLSRRRFVGNAAHSPQLWDLWRFLAVNHPATNRRQDRELLSACEQCEPEPSPVTAGLLGCQCVGSVGTLNPGAPEGFVTICGGLLQYPVGGVRHLTPRPAQWKCGRAFVLDHSDGLGLNLRLAGVHGFRFGTRRMAILYIQI